LLGLALELISSAFLTYRCLWDCTLWVQKWHSLHGDPSTASCTHMKVISDSHLYFQYQNIYRTDADLSANVEPA